MKTKLTCLASISGKLIMLLLFGAFVSSTYGQDENSQGAISLTYKKFTVPAKADYFFQGANASGVAIPAQGINRRWDYSNLTKNDANNDAMSFVPANNSAYPGALRQFDNYFQLAGLPILQSNMQGNDEESFHGLGTHFDRQAFPLQSITGGVNDSLVIDMQNVQEPDQIFQKYPVTYLSSFSSHSISRTNFHLTIAAFGLNNVPGQFVQHTYDSRNVVGWGKVKVPTENGPSNWIKVLLEKLSVLKVDSVYLAGQPAPAALLAAFGVSQGGTTHSFYQYRFYQRDIEAYVMNFFMDPTFSTITGLNYDTKFVAKNPNSLIAANTTTNASTSTGMVKVYPNPSPNEFVINLANKNKATVVVFDLSGRQVQRFENVSATLKFGRDLKPGTYVVQVILNNEKHNFKLVKSE